MNMIHDALILTLADRPETANLKMTARSIVTMLAWLALVCPLAAQKSASPVETGSVATSEPDDQADTSNVVRVSATGELRRIEGTDEYAVSFDLGDLPMGKTAVMRLKIVNPLDEDVSYSDVSKRCVCSQFAPRKSTIPKNDSREAVLRMKTPASSQTPRVSIPVILLRDGSPSVRMSLDFGLEGLLSFTQLVSVLRFEGDDQVRTENIDFLMTPPVQLGDLRVEHSDNLQGVDFQILPGPNGGILRAEVPDKVLSDGDVRGEVFLINSATGQRRTLYFSIKDGRRSEISPRVIRFQRAPDGWRAMAVVRMGSRGRGRADSMRVDSRDGAAPVHCSLRGVSLEVKWYRISDSMFRVELFVPADREDDLMTSTGDIGETVLRWVISNGSATSELKTPYVIDAAIDD